MSDERTDPMAPDDAGTKEAEHVDEQAHTQADRPPTPDEEAAAERGAESSPDVSKDYEQAMETGAKVKGEGQI